MSQRVMKRMKTHHTFASRQHHRPRSRLLSKAVDRVEFDGKWCHPDRCRRPYRRVDFLRWQTSREIPQVKQRCVQTASRQRLASGTRRPAKLLRALHDTGRRLGVREKPASACK
jgi:hypothetical protein